MLISLVIWLVIIACFGLFARWAANELQAPDILIRVGTVLFVLFALLALLGLFGYGPVRIR